MTDVASVSAGTRHTLVVRSDGSLWAMGNNVYGQLGDGTTADRTTPVFVMDGVQAVDAKGYQTLIMKTDGSLWVAGRNQYGQLGDGTRIDRPLPIQILP